MGLDPLAHRRHPLPHALCSPHGAGSLPAPGKLQMGTGSAAGPFPMLAHRTGR